MDSSSVGSVILKLTYGIECRSHEDPWIAKSEALHKITALASQPGRWLVDSFPIRETELFQAAEWNMP